MEIRIHKRPNDCYLTENQIRHICTWLSRYLNLPVQSLGIVFTSDDELQSMHHKYLNDPTYTDVMVFNLGDENNIESEIYISFDRARENALKYKVSIQNEITRLIIHACLHLAGFQDNTTHLKKQMKQEEDNLLEIVSQKFLY